MKTNLLRVLIVDDEYLIRELLKKQVDWEMIECEIVGEASCAAEVFDILEEMPVDLIITDINMPKTDGLEMSKLILESYPKMKIIILTGYDKFEYAQTGIEMGIADYILKPIQKTKIEQAILNVKRTIEKERKKELEYHFVKEKLQENLPYIKEKFLIELLQNNLSKGDIEDKLSFLQLTFYPEEKFQVAVIELDSSADHKLSEEDKLITLLGMKHMVEDYYLEIDGAHIILDSNERITICYNNLGVCLIEECDDLLVMIKDHFTCNVAIGIGSKKTVIQDMKYSYKEALIALRYKTILGINTVICYKDLDMISNESYTLSVIGEEEIEQLQFFIKAGLKENAMNYIELLFNNMGKKRNVENETFIEHVRVQTTRLVSMLFYMVASTNIKMDTLIGNEGCYFNSIAGIGTIPDAKEIVRSLVKEIVSCVNSIQTHIVNDYMKDVEEYIKNNIGNYGLTLKKVASHFYLNPSYLSRIFKQKIGITFKDYVNKIRMEKAVEYVRNTDMKVYEIGEKIGIPDANYFSAIFKKHIGMSLTAYKKHIGK